MPISINDDNNLAFKEEQNNLARVEKRINRIVSDSEKELQKQENELKDFVIYDYDDHSRMITLKKDVSRHRETVDEYRRIINSPYFGRFDVSSNEDAAIPFFVGHDALIDPNNADAIIVDWRSPIADIYYNKSEHHFNVKGTEYDLLLRRTVDIQNQKLRSVQTDYDSVSLSIDGEVVDEFLISVLRDKRRNNRITDIIRTIQENQNAIIRKSLDENFVVQGCAGSGKTMILLHRLSYIAFNNPGINFNNFYILTPNENFNLQLNELSQSLGLDKIKRITVEEFYSDIIHSLAQMDGIIKNGKRVPKITATVDGLVSEKLLNKDLLSLIYSEQFRTELEGEYHRKSREAAEIINKTNLIDVLSRNGYKVEIFNEVDYKVYSAVVFALANAKNKHNEAINKLSELKDNLAKTEKRLVRLESEAPVKEETLQHAKNDIQNMCEEMINELQNEEKTLREDLAVIESKQDVLVAERDEKLESSRLMQQSLSSIEKSPEKYTSYDYLVSSEDEVARAVSQQCALLIDELKELYVQLDSLAFYNFSKKNKLNADITQKRQGLDSAAKLALDEYIDRVRSDIDADSNSRVDDLNKSIAGVEAEINEIEKNYRDTLSYLNICKEIYSECKTDKYPNLNYALPDYSDLKISNALNVYMSAYEEYYRNISDVSAAERNRARLVSDIESNEKILINEDDLQAIDISLETIRAFDIRDISKTWEKRLRDLYKQHGESFSVNDNYRHRMYLKLLLCSLYYGTVESSKYYINIDEAQDFAKVEYELLRKVVGNKAVFNLYGDVNQSIYEYKGISDWDEVKGVVQDNVYLLNENYRNTKQITDYCNAEFGAEVVAIGLNGADVLYKDFDDAINLLKDLYKENPDMRAAIIYRRGLNGIETELRKRKLRCVFHTIEERGISVITVEEAKGLEFGAVVVVDNDMTGNESYISYTRALDNLIITSL